MPCSLAAMTVRRAKEAGVESIQVKDPNESKRVIEPIIACLGWARHATHREKDAP
jgi:hypothetical protein